jgi:hypothetical protein
VREGKKVWGGVSISAGYIALINHLAHAKAIDTIEPGYFRQYMLNLGRQTGNASAPDPPDMVDNRYWTDQVMNEQASYFNEMAGMTLALSLSDHYLGHFNQYANQMLAGKLVPINNFIPAGSWEAGLQAAALNCLEYGVPVRGARALFEAIDQMPTRPAWTAFIAPPTADLKKVSAQLQDYQDAFFHGRLKLTTLK